MPNATVRASATALLISDLTRDSVLRRALASRREPPSASAFADRIPVRRPSGGAAPATRVLELVEV